MKLETLYDLIRSLREMIRLAPSESGAPLPKTCEARRVLQRAEQEAGGQVMRVFGQNPNVRTINLGMYLRDSVTGDTWYSGEVRVSWTPEAAREFTNQFGESHGDTLASSVVQMSDFEGAIKNLMERAKIK